MNLTLLLSLHKPLQIPSVNLNDFIDLHFLKFGLKKHKGIDLTLAVSLFFKWNKLIFSLSSFITFRYSLLIIFCSVGYSLDLKKSLLWYSRIQ